MKRQLLFLLSIASFGAVKAQITITPTDIASPGYIMYRGIDTAYTEEPIGPSGSNLTWDFSGIVDDMADTVTFVDPATLPNYSNFPSSNLGVIISGQGAAYCVKDNASLRIIGQSAIFQGQGVALDVNPAEIIIKFPSTFITNWTNTSNSSAAAPVTGQAGVDSGRVMIQKTKNVIVDAWGNLITPIGTNAVIRQKESIQTDQNIEVHTTGPFPPAGWYPFQSTSTTETTFTYWANGMGFPIMQADSADAGQVDITWLILPPQAGIKNVTEENYAGKTFPNPANEQVHILLNNNSGVEIEIFDVQGRLVKKQHAAGAVASVTVADLEKGAYSFKVIEKGETTLRGKFVISR